MKLRTVAIILLAALPLSAAPTDRAAMAAKIRAEFLYSWKAYEQYAWGHDELRPLTRQPRDWYGQSLLMTPLDSLDTLLLMDLPMKQKRRGASVFRQCEMNGTDKSVCATSFLLLARLRPVAAANVAQTLLSCSVKVATITVDARSVNQGAAPPPPPPPTRAVCSAPSRC
jgi:hypothetical protein